MTFGLKIRGREDEMAEPTYDELKSAPGGIWKRAGCGTAASLSIQRWAKKAE